jgi:hypothetical protein
MKSGTCCWPIPKGDQVIMHIETERTPKALNKRD